ncbi:MAG TPA: phosphatase PAP2 family protein [Egibacteraceae bacterium]|nr:phosphatase PAP2 family protein [Egibacteraceae bacterium]
MSRKRTDWVGRALIGGALLGGSWLALRRPEAQRVDVRIGDALRHAGSDGLDKAVTHTTDLGSVYAVAGVAGVLAATGRRRMAGDVLGAGLAAWSLGQGAKTRVKRARPYEADGVRRLVRPPTGSSFPSGHAAVGTAMATVLADRARGPAAAGLFDLLGAYVALSRVYVGVHYPTDVIGGAGLGLLIGSVWRGPVAKAGRRLVSLPLRRLRSL